MEGWLGMIVRCVGRAKDYWGFCFYSGGGCGIGREEESEVSLCCAGVKLPNGRSSVQENTCQTRSGIQAEDESGSWNKSLWYLKLFERCLRGGGGTGDTEGT